MTIGERIREIRKAESLTQERLGERVGTSGGAISMVENGRNSPTNHLITSICREFGIREEWLRNGTGSMYVSGNARLEATLRGVQSEGDPFKISLITMLAQMDKDTLMLVQRFAVELIQETERRRIEAIRDGDIEAQVEEYRRQLLLEKEARESGASISTDTKTA